MGCKTPVETKVAGGGKQASAATPTASAVPTTPAAGRANAGATPGDSKKKTRVVSAASVVAPQQVAATRALCASPGVAGGGALAMCAAPSAAEGRARKVARDRAEKRASELELDGEEMKVRLAALPACRWVPMDAYGCLWVPMGVYAANAGWRWRSDRLAAGRLAGWLAMAGYADWHLAE